MSKKRWGTLRWSDQEDLEELFFRMRSAMDVVDDPEHPSDLITLSKMIVQQAEQAVMSGRMPTSEAMFDNAVKTFVQHVGREPRWR